MSAPAYEVAELDSKGRHVATISGIGRNRGTWDTTARTLSTAQRWARECRRQHPGRRFVAVRQFEQVTLRAYASRPGC